MFRGGVGMTFGPSKLLKILSTFKRDFPIFSLHRGGFRATFRWAERSEANGKTPFKTPFKLQTSKKQNLPIRAGGPQFFPFFGKNLLQIIGGFIGGWLIWGPGASWPKSTEGLIYQTESGQNFACKILIFWRKFDLSNPPAIKKSRDFFIIFVFC